MHAEQKLEVVFFQKKEKYSKKVSKRTYSGRLRAGLNERILAFSHEIKRKICENF